MVFNILSTSSTLPASIGSCIRRMGPIKKWLARAITPMKYNIKDGQKLLTILTVMANAIASKPNQKRYLINTL